MFMRPSRTPKRLELIRNTETSQGDRDEHPAESHGGEDGRQAEANPRKRKRSLSVSLSSLTGSYPTSEHHHPPSASPAPSDPGPWVRTNVPYLRYRGKVTMLRPEAKNFALEIDQAPHRTSKVSRFVFWTDCSIIRRCGAGSIVWRQAPLFKAWNSAVYRFPTPTSDTGLVELFAIEHALAIAVNQVSEAKRAAFNVFSQSAKDHEIQPRYRVLIFTDSEAALHRLQKDTSWHHKPAFWQHEYECIERFLELEKFGASVKLFWVPSHSGVPGNVQADGVARELARRMAAEKIQREMRLINLTMETGVPSRVAESTQDTFPLEESALVVNTARRANPGETNTGLARIREAARAARRAGLDRINRPKAATNPAAAKTSTPQATLNTVSLQGTITPKLTIQDPITVSANQTRTVQLEIPVPSSISGSLFANSNPLSLQASAVTSMQTIEFAPSWSAPAPSREQVTQVRPRVIHPFPPRPLLTYPSTAPPAVPQFGWTL